MAEKFPAFYEAERDMAEALEKKKPATFPCLNPEESAQSLPNFVWISSLQFVLYISAKHSSSNYPKLGPR